MGRLGCSLLSLAGVGVIIALATTGLLEQSVTLIKGALGGRKVDSEFMMRNNCRQLLAALRLYASEHGESYPENLYDLAPDPLSDGELDRLLTEGASGDSAISAAWILIPRVTPASAASDILILSVRPVARGCHTAGLNDGSVIPITAADAAAFLSRSGI